MQGFDSKGAYALGTSKKLRAILSRFAVANPSRWDWQKAAIPLVSEEQEAEKEAREAEKRKEKRKKAKENDKARKAQAQADAQRQEEERKQREAREAEERELERVRKMQAAAEVASRLAPCSGLLLTPALLFSCNRER